MFFSVATFSIYLFTNSAAILNPIVLKIEITSWKARAYEIFTRVGAVSEIERVSAANE